MNLRHFAYFLAIAEECSISRAAERLYVSQPSLSHFLSKLENEVGAQLFLRKKNQIMQLTKIGEEFVTTARTILSSWECFQKRVYEAGESTHPKITLGFAAQDCPLLLNTIIPCLNEQYPNIEIEIVHGRPQLLQQKVINGEIDLGYSAYSRELPQLTYYRMEHEEVDLIVPLEHPLAENAYPFPGDDVHRIKLASVGDAPFVLSQQGTVINYVERSYFKEVGFTPNVRISTDNTIDSVDIVRKLGCLGFCPRINRDEAQGKVALIALEPPMYYGGGIYYRKNADQLPAVKELIRLIKEAFPQTDSKK